MPKKTSKATPKASPKRKKKRRKASGDNTAHSGGHLPEGDMRRTLAGIEKAGRILAAGGKC